MILQIHIFFWLVLCWAGAFCLLKRLPRDYHHAKHAVWARCLLLRHLQAMRGWQREMMKGLK